MEESGMLSLISFSDRESKLFLEYLRKYYDTPAYDFINYLIGKDYIKFLDLLAGAVIKIPNQKNTYRDMEYIKIYLYVTDHGGGEEAMKSASRIYNKKLSFVRRAFSRVSDVIKDSKVEDIEESVGEDELNE